MPLSKVKIRWGYLIALLLMLLSYGLIFFIIGNLARETGWVTHSYNVIQKMESIKAEMTDAETGVRGYLITNDFYYLRPYHSGSRNVVPLYEQLKDLTKDNRKYRKKIDTLGGLIKRRLQSLDAAIVEFQTSGNKITPALLAPSEQNKLVMDSIRQILQDLGEQESLLVRRRDQNLDGFFNSTSVITAVSLVIAIVTIIYSVLIYNRENKAKENAIRNVRSYGQQLEDRVVELDKVNRELQELKSIEKFAATGRIARTIAHEVRNPLTNISLASEQLRELTDNQEESEILIEMIGRNVTRINQLVSDLLNSTRFAQLEYTSVDMNALLDEALHLAADRIELNGVQVVKRYASDLCEVVVDKEKVKIAILNIIVNAIEAMEEGGGRLEIRTRKEENKCVIEIADNGSGMDEETISRLFEPYFTNKKKGNGLGLTNTQNIILNHKGSIQVKSRLGEGTQFTLTLNLKGSSTEWGTDSP
ncbi:MAG: sensor histidine kinase [Chitinophagaceae bacterium]